MAELIISLSVAVIVVGIALPRVRALIDEGNLAKAVSDLKTLQLAVESYAAGHGRVYPEAVSALPDPFSGSGGPYGYRKTADGKVYVLWSLGPDRQPDLLFDAATGAISGPDDDLYLSNGAGGTGGF